MDHERAYQTTHLFDGVSPHKVLGTIGAVFAALIGIPLLYLLFVVGPLWPVGRLVMLASGPVAAAVEEVNDPAHERVLCWLALGCFTVAAATAGFGWWEHQPGLLLAALSPAFVYCGLTYIAFDRGFRRIAHEVREVVLLTGFAIVAIADLIFNPNEYEYDPVARDNKTASGSIAGALCIAVVVLVAIGAGVDWTLCKLFSSCGWLGPSQ